MALLDDLSIHYLEPSALCREELHGDGAFLGDLLHLPGGIEVHLAATVVQEDNSIRPLGPYHDRDS